MGKSLDEGDAFGAAHTDLSRALNCFLHELLITKLHIYGADTSSVKLLHSYLTKHKWRVKLSGTYSSWSEIIFGFLQGSMLGPFLFNIFLYDSFQFLPGLDIVNYADDKSPSTTINLKKVWYDTILKKSHMLYSNNLPKLF